MFVYLSLLLSIYLCLSNHLSVYVSTHLSIRQSIYYLYDNSKISFSLPLSLSFYIPIDVHIYQSSFFSLFMLIAFCACFCASEFQSFVLLFPSFFLCQNSFHSLRLHSFSFFLSIPFFSSCHLKQSTITPILSNTIFVQMRHTNCPFLFALLFTITTCLIFFSVLPFIILAKTFATFLDLSQVRFRQLSRRHKFLDGHFWNWTPSVSLWLAGSMLLHPGHQYCKTFSTCRLL